MTLTSGCLMVLIAIGVGGGASTAAAQVGGGTDTAQSCAHDLNTAKSAPTLEALLNCLEEIQNQTEIIRVSQQMLADQQRSLEDKLAEAISVIQNRLAVQQRSLEDKLDETISATQNRLAVQQRSLEDKLDETISVTQNRLADQQRSLSVTQSRLADQQRSFEDKLAAFLGVKPDAGPNFEERVQQVEELITRLREEVQWELNWDQRPALGIVVVSRYRRLIPADMPPPADSMLLTVTPLTSMLASLKASEETVYSLPHILEVVGQSGKYETYISPTLKELAAENAIPLEKFRIDLKFEEDSAVLASTQLVVSPPIKP